MARSLERRVGSPFILLCFGVSLVGMFQRSQPVLGAIGMGYGEDKVVLFYA